MHKFRKLLVLLLFPLVMFSCGADKYYGYYMFQLGEEKGEHFGFHITLTKKKSHDEGAKEDSKEFKFGMKATESFLPPEPEIPEEADPEEYVEFLKELFLYVVVSYLNTENDGPGITGYYNIGKKDIGDKGRTLDLNVVLPIDPEDSIPNLENALKKLLISYVDGKNVTAVLPVSLDDVFYQLAWHGYFFSVDLTGEGEIEDAIRIVDLTHPYPVDHPEIYVELPGKQGEGRLDTHPTDLDRVAMNKMFYCDPLIPEEPDPDNNRYPIQGWSENWFARDFHTLTATLIKQ